MPPVRQHMCHEPTPVRGCAASRCHQGSWIYHAVGRRVGKIGSSRRMLPSATNTKHCWHTWQRCFSCRLTKASSNRLPHVRQRTSMVVSRFFVSRFVVVVVFVAVGGGEATVPTVTSIPHCGHLKVRPVALSGTRSLAPHDEQAKESGMMGAPKRNGATTTQRGAPPGPAKGLNEQPGRRPFGA